MRSEALKRPLEAQEMLEKFGFVVIESEDPFETGDIVWAGEGTTAIPVGCNLRVMGELGRSEAANVCRASGWFIPVLPFIYKAIAE